MERTVTLKLGEVPDSKEEISRRGWNRLGTYLAPANVAVEREFYANVKHISNDDIPFLSYVRGRRIPYDVEAINSFLNIEWESGTTSFEYAHLLKEEVDYEAIESVVCRPRGTFRRNKQGQPIHLIRSNLRVVSQIWMALIFSNISPCSHVSDVNLSKALIRYTIVARKTINLGTLIVEEIRQCAHAAGRNVPLYAILQGLTPPLHLLTTATNFKLIFLYAALPSLRQWFSCSNTTTTLSPTLLNHLLSLSLTCYLIWHPFIEVSLPLLGCFLNMMYAGEFDEYVVWPGDESHSIGGGGAATDDDTDEDEEEEGDDDSKENDDNI
ncbi:hypothetical protein V8G54_029584 [Vigna mungo]|uniref:Putative plant transposon protein domain-containing protein n=1 Tax=Vigna mungo TaxID=3915 RepID=A0AAQ3MUZ9_VIGMU